MMKTVNEHLLDQICAVKNSYGARNYKKHQKRVNFLLRINQSHGRNQLLTMTEINKGKLNQIIA